MKEPSLRLVKTTTKENKRGTRVLKKSKSTGNKDHIRPK
jgi:hypothetical protein